MAFTLRGVLGCAVAWGVLVNGSAGAGAMAAPSGSPVPVLRSGRSTLDVRDGRWLDRNAWVPDPRVPVDRYVARRSATARRVTFYSDLDSLGFLVAPGDSVEFDVVVGDSSRFRTRIVDVPRGMQRTPSGGAPEPTGIPMRYGRNHKLAVQGRVNGSAPLELLFDTGAWDVGLWPPAFRKGVTVHFDRTVEMHGAGGVEKGRASDDNVFEMSGLRWPHEPVSTLDRQPNPYDGILGFGPFEESVVELDFERMRFVVHDQLPPLGEGWTRLPIRWDGTLQIVDLTVTTPGGRHVQPFVLDTGANGSLMFGAAEARELGLPGSLKRLGTGRATGVGRGRTPLVRALLPAVEFGSVRLPDVPVVVQDPATGGRELRNLLGLELLRRFHCYIDYRGSALYLRPNADLRAPYPARFRSGVAMFPIVIAGTVLLLGAVLAARRIREGRGG